MARIALMFAFVVVVGACARESSTTATPASPTPSSAPTDATAPTAPEPLTPTAPVVDEASGLIKAKGWELVAANCIACHSSKLITQNRGDRARWQDTIRWMQKTQGLWPLAPDVEDTILTYLSTHYAPDAIARRKPLAPSLMPPSVDEIARARAMRALLADPRVDEAKRALAPFQKALMGALQEGLAKGAPSAVETCADRAPKIAAEGAAKSVVVGRTTDKLRNRANAPEPWATPILDELGKLPPDARAPRVVVVDDPALGAGTLVYAAPITVAPLCLTCHGERIAPDVDAAIRARYPDDEARGYTEGALRGLFYVKVAQRAP